MTIGVLSCQKSYTGGLRWNESGLWFPHADVARHVAVHEPDLLYFAGDQIYEGDLTPAVRAPLEAALGDYLTKWYRHGWSFGELTRRLPTVVVTDDHDVYHGNIWGNAGRREDVEGLSKQDRGGYVMPTEFVNAVHRTQVAHLPATHAAEPLEGGITPYHTVLQWGGGSFAILRTGCTSRRPPSWSPRVRCATAGPRPRASTPRRRRTWRARCCSGRISSRCSTPGAAPRDRTCGSVRASPRPPSRTWRPSPQDATSGERDPELGRARAGRVRARDKRAADMDSNGWPQSGRDRAVRALRAAGAFHLAGDQHLGSTLRYGVDAFDDAGVVLASPAVANTWPRRWYPDPGTDSPAERSSPERSRPSADSSTASATG